MQLSPRYGSAPVITLDGDPAAIAAPTIRQRRRLASLLADFDQDQWDHPSRCEGWSSRDVILHLDGTNGFWSASISAGVAGTPTQFLATFDPATTPALLVAAEGEVSADEVLERFVASNETLISLLESLDHAAWSALAEAPLGHLSISAVAHHALWDAWVHERDILLPLGIDPVVEDDEVAASLRYAAALSPAFALTSGVERTGLLSITATEPNVVAEIAVDRTAAVRSSLSGGPYDLELAGDALELLDGLSVRAALTPSVGADGAWMLQGLVEAFDG